MKNNGLIVESEIVRRLSFKAEYDVSCDLLSGYISGAVLRSTLTHRRDQIQKICAGSEYIKKNSRKFIVAIPVRKPMIERVFVRTG